DVFDDVGTFASMKIDSNNFAHIAYRDETHNKLKYARVDLNKPINSILDQTIESVTTGGISAALAVTHDGTVYIAHQVYDLIDGKIFYFAQNQNGIWKFDFLKDSDLISPLQLTSIALDNNEVPHVAIALLGNHLSEFTINNDFIETPIENEDGAFPSIAISKNNNEHIAYNSVFNIRLATKEENAWSIEDLLTTRGYAGVKTAVDSENSVFVFYSEPDVATITCAIKSNGNWIYHLIDENVLTFDPLNIVKGTNFDIAIDSNDRIHLVYYDFITHRLTYGTTADVE
ncbi:MAG: hypothetical protein ACD_46C00542G0003, partial [uncultured bacterium]